MCICEDIEQLDERQKLHYIWRVGWNDSSSLSLRRNTASIAMWEERMLIVSIFAVGLLGGSLGVFSFVVLEIVVCCVAFAGFWNEGLVRACWKSLEMGAIVTAGFNCALIAQYVCAKFRFWRMTIRQRDDVGFFYVAAGREAEPVRFFLRPPGPIRAKGRRLR